MDGGFSLWTVVLFILCYTVVWIVQPNLPPYISLWTVGGLYGVDLDCGWIVQPNPPPYITFAHQNLNT